MASRNVSSGAALMRRVGFAVVLMALQAPSWAREKITLQKSGSNAQARAGDSYVDQSSPNSTHGGVATLQVLASGRKAQRSLVEFDFDAVPNAGIKSAILNLHVMIPPAAARNYEAHMITSFFLESDASWNIRAAGVPWNAAGVDFNGTATATAAVTPTSTSVSWDITPDAQLWYNGTANYGTLIKDSKEAGGSSTVFSSKEDPNPANRPSLTLLFVQNVINLTAAAGSNSVTLNWAYPAAIGTVMEPNVGVVILRRRDVPVDKFSEPTDGSDPALCSTPGGSAGNNGNGVVVFDNFASATAFTDDASDPCGAPANGHTWFYKVFLRDQANNYATNGLGSAPQGGSTFTAEISGTPDATAPYNSTWIAATHSTNLAAPAVNPANIAMPGSQSGLFFGVDANLNRRTYLPVSVSSAISDRSAIIAAADSSLGQNVAYVADQDGFVYAINTDTGQFIWVVNPTSNTGNSFVGAPSVFVKSFAGPAYTRSTDLVVVGTDNGSTRGNFMFGLDGNTGATVWQVSGGAGGVPAMDIITESPQIDYVHTSIWFGSHSNGGTAQPSLWKIDANAGIILGTAKLDDVDGSPTLTTMCDVVFIANNDGTLFAVNPLTLTTLGSVNSGDGTVVGFPLVDGVSSPFMVIASTATMVQRFDFSTTTNTFTRIWQTPLNTPSAPIDVPGLGTIYIGAADGMIHELSLATGIDGKQRVANSGQPGIVGDPSLDTILSRVYVSTTDQRSYAFTIPF